MEITLPLAKSTMITKVPYKASIPAPNARGNAVQDICRNRNTPDADAAIDNAMLNIF